MSTFADLKVHELRSELAVRGIDTTGIKSALIRRLSDFEAENPATQRKKRRREPKDDDATALENLRKMGVRELREAAVARGVSSDGTKKEILERIAVVIQETGSMGDGVVQDLQVKNEEVESDCLNTVSAIEILKKMGVKELRQQAGIRGISKSGTKRELLEKLTAALGEKEDITEDVKVEEVVRQEKLVTATKKGAAVLDQWLPEQYKATYHVLQRGSDVYDATLNQTNVGDNNNKYYIIQALESDNGGTFMVYNRWGRVGVKGQSKLHGPYTSEQGAINEFELKFHSKTKNHWSDRKQFTYHSKCYTLLEMDYEGSQGTGNEAVETRIEKPLTVNKKSQLDPRLAQFISLICNINMMKQHMLMIGYNAEKLPLGKLSKSTILKGYDVLRRISIVVEQSDRKELERLSGEFYTVIPHDFGFKKMREFVIDTPQKLKLKLAMVEALGEIEIATKLLKDDLDDMNDPLYSCYQHLNCDLLPIEVASNEFSMINKYLVNTHAKTHSNYSVNIEQIFKVSRKAEDDWFKKFSGVKNRMLLWHGSRLTNWAGILSQGLRIAPPEAPVTGYMFGKGVYFADMFSKSANYCCSTPQARTGVLLLCEVALGDMSEYLSADYNANNLPDGKLSTKGVGITEPDSSEFQKLDDGVIVPLGKPKEHSNRKGSLLYNEYIVYNVEQIRMRYVVQVNFNFKR